MAQKLHVTLSEGNKRRDAVEPHTSLFSLDHTADEAVGRCGCVVSICTAALVCRDMKRRQAREFGPECIRKLGHAREVDLFHYVCILDVYILYSVQICGVAARKVRVRSNKTRLIEELKHQILTMELDPDEVLDEVSLGKRYGLSRTPVREVFLRLAGEGYIDIQENRGARVTSMSYATLRNFFLVAPMIYAAVGRLAVQHFKPRQLADLEETQKRFRQASRTGDTLSLVLENNRFHEIMGEMSGNVYLRASLARLLIDHARIGHTYFRPRNDDMKAWLQQSVEHHDAFIAAIAGHDEEAVVDLVYEHWELASKNMELFIMPKGLVSDTFNGEARLLTESVQ